MLEEEELKVLADLQAVSKAPGAAETLISLVLASRSLWQVQEVPPRSSASLCAGMLPDDLVEEPSAGSVDVGELDWNDNMRLPAAEKLLSQGSVRNSIQAQV